MEGIAHLDEGLAYCQQALNGLLACAHRIDGHAHLFGRSVDFQPAVGEQIFDLRRVSMSAGV